MSVDLSIHNRIKEAVVATLLRLSLPSIQSRVYAQLLPDENNVEFPCVVVTNEGEREEEEWSQTDYIGVWYPLRVQFCDRADKTRHERAPLYTGWRWQAMNAFRTNRLQGVPEVRAIRLVPELVIDPKLPQYQFVVSGFVLKCWAAQARPAAVG